ncbi:MAG: replicative DNA helicase [Sedimentisphaerales bacterium]|nr:replicative DNA helicase [Sedimentisphaerales bacterium]
MNQPTKTLKNNTPGFSPVTDERQGAATRSMPESLESEAAVLGSMIIDRECIGQVVQIIKTEDFYRPEHQAIFDALISLYERNSDIDLVLLRDELKTHKELKNVGGAEYLVTIAESVPSSASVEYYAEIVKNKSLLRQLVSASNQILSEAMDESGDVSDKLDQAEQKIFAVTEKKITGVAEPLKNLLLEAFDNIEARKGSHLTGLPTSYYELDNQLCGLQKGEMIIIAGRPSMGKTSFALNIAEHIGADNDIPVAIFSLEMGKQQLVERFLCSRSKINSQKVRKGILSTDELLKLQNASGQLFEKPIFIDDTPGLTPLMIRAKCRRLKSQHDIQCVLIDYLQLMSLGGRVESRQQEVSTMSRYLKALARELDVPVVVLSQLNRGAEGREGHRPRMSDLRESGSIEQDADVVMLLHREDYYHRGEEGYEENNTAEVIIAKQRNGPTGLIKLLFDGEFTRFENLSVMDEPGSGSF